MTSEVEESQGLSWAVMGGTGVNGLNILLQRKFMKLREGGTPYIQLVWMTIISEFEIWYILGSTRQKEQK